MSVFKVLEKFFEKIIAQILLKLHDKQSGELIAEKIFNALLFDKRSIQRYIYSGNKLRTNVGASYIVDRNFFDVLIDGG